MLKYLIDNTRSILSLIVLYNLYNNQLRVDLNVATTLLINTMEDEWRDNVLLQPKLKCSILFKNSRRRVSDLFTITS